MICRDAGKAVAQRRGPAVQPIHQSLPRPLCATRLGRVTTALPVACPHPSQPSTSLNEPAHQPRTSQVCSVSRRQSVYLFGLGGGDDYYDDEAYTVLKFQVGVFGNISKWQRDLDRLADLYDTEDEEGLHSVLREVLQMLLRNSEYCSYVNSGGRVFQDPDQAESKFNEVSFEERAKAQEETLTNVEGRMQQRRSSTRQDPSTKDLDQWMCITLILAVERQIKLPKISSLFDLKQAIKTLAGITVDELLAFEMMWTPQDDGDSYSKDELLADYPQMVTLV